MTTSRTGTGKYRRNRARVIAQARADGVVYCPGFTDRAGQMQRCGCWLDFDTPGLPNSAEADHVIDYQFGGSDEIENLRVLCRRCNLARNRSQPKPTAPTSLRVLATYW